MQLSRRQRWELGPKVLTLRLMPQREDAPHLLLCQASSLKGAEMGEVLGPPGGSAQPGQCSGGAWLGAAPDIPKPCSFPQEPRAQRWGAVVGSVGPEAAVQLATAQCGRVHSSQWPGGPGGQGVLWRAPGLCIAAATPISSTLSSPLAVCTQEDYKDLPWQGTSLERLQPWYPRTCYAGTGEDQRWFCL